MTTQILDTVDFNGVTYGVFGVQGGLPFTPQQFGMTPAMLHTACYRGYHVHYALGDAGLRLRELTVQERDGRYVPIDGRGPVPARIAGMTYKQLDVPVTFTGRMRLARDFRRWQAAVRAGDGATPSDGTAMARVLDVTLQDGRVVAVRDRSEEAHRLRMEEERPEAWGMDPVFAIIGLERLDPGEEWWQTIKGEMSPGRTGDGG
ncbi:MAG TPA: hypothetical protein VG818_09745 [Gemmatimonadaceae bacterium]|nr:hypothetical protein [Gemmatimonadaceae bacterium]